MKKNTHIKIWAAVAALLVVLLAAAMIIFFNQSDSELPSDNVVSMVDENEDGGEESGTLQTNPNDDGFGTEVSM